MTHGRSQHEYELEQRIAELEEEVRDLHLHTEMLEAERDAMMRVVEAGLRLPWWLRPGYYRACNNLWEASERAWRRVASKKELK